MTDTALREALHRLIIENRDGTEAIDKSDQGAMADEIEELIQTALAEQREAIIAGLPKKNNAGHTMFRSSEFEAYSNGFDKAIDTIKRQIQEMK